MSNIKKCPYCNSEWKFLWRKPYHRATHYCKALEVNIVTGEYHDKEKLIDRLNLREGEQSDKDKL